MSIIEYEDKIVEIVNKDDHSNFLYELLAVYDIPRATITRLKSGNQNLAKQPGEIHLKNRVWFKEIKGETLFKAFVRLEDQTDEIAAKPRYLIVTDFDGLLAKDMKTKEALDIKFKELPQHFSFFLSWNGIEKVDFEKENPADIKAAERFARIYDVVKKENKHIDNNNGIDIFFIRLLFCMFAEDTDIFERGSFTNSIKSITHTDGTDLNDFFGNLFEILDTKERDNVPNYLKKFPYVNGQLFTEPHKKLTFSDKARKLIIECGELLNWAKINPDIFGSMIQAVATDVSRSQLGMHYTSVPNIMKVINSLFLDDLNKAFEEAYNNFDKLNILYDRLGKIKFFDPACGSGNFLIITYKELRRLEIKILLRQRDLTGDLMYIPSVTLDQFFGIELDEFAHDVAKLSLWITEHQMNMELEEIFGDKVRPTLPLQSAGDIRCGNALKLDWLDVCPQQESEEIYIFGNPPYLGSKRQSKTQKEDLLSIFKDVKNSKMLDYIAGWFFLGSQYISGTKSKLAFVSTNSISQGEQVSILWPILFQQNIEIKFAYKPFKWNNNAKNNAGVTVTIIGLHSKDTSNNEKRLYLDNTVQIADNITPYLTSGPNVLVRSTRKSISNLPEINFGSMPNDGGNLLLTREEYPKFIQENPEADKYIRKFVGSDEFVNSNYRYCIWIKPNELEEAKTISAINKRIEKVKSIRVNSTRASTKKLAAKPYSFGEVRHQDKIAIAVPAHTSENRYYIPMGLSGKDTILSNAIYAIYGADIYILGILLSRMHMVWVKAVCGRLESRYRYTAGICYNTFPINELSTRRKNEIEQATLEILDIREELGGSLAELYNPRTMPIELKDAHDKLDGIIDRAYRSRPFDSDEERLALLLNMYQKMTEK